MRTRILARVRETGEGWLASAFKAESAFCEVQADSQAGALADLKAQVQAELGPQVRTWLEQWRGAEDAPNCPEGAIKLPIDLWACKLLDVTCPIQAQVFLGDPEAFFSGCLAPAERKQEVFEAVSQGKYDGFHHVPGRYLCVSCESEGKKESLRYHYPWELTSLEAYSPFVMPRDWPMLRRRLGRRITISMTTTDLCAPHCIHLAELLDPALAAELRVIEYELSRSSEWGEAT